MMKQERFRNTALIIVNILLVLALCWKLSHKCPEPWKGEMFQSDAIHASFVGLESSVATLEPILTQDNLFNGEDFIELEWRTCELCGGEYIHIISNGVPVIVERPIISHGFSE